MVLPQPAPLPPGTAEVTHRIQRELREMEVDHVLIVRDGPITRFSQFGGAAWALGAMQIYSAELVRGQIDGLTPRDGETA